MKTLVVYDSTYGNTERIARAVAGAIDGAAVRRPADVEVSDLSGIDLLVVGSPTQGGRPTKAIQEFVSGLGKSVRGVRVAAFDTRLPSGWVRIFGYAAGRIAGSLRRRGGALATPAEAFFVAGKMGPLRPGEEDRAADWAKRISESGK